jgi:hypothetical protein
MWPQAETNWLLALETGYSRPRGWTLSFSPFLGLLPSVEYVGNGK